ncbi:hypothetical protein CH063_00711 [Colletotrichum higginsianum]|uniref:Uncharacterized protein n=1 Tax=Colletotrichum higginsianum (strain IMI 349063) TaxID=759273 RepID=H1UUZ4_COLHI|nr:hypothetical protein CH063_00711 [Colletotrichum higginsianum]
MLQAACGYLFTAGTDQLSIPCRHHFVWMGIFWAPLHRMGKSSPLLLRNDSHHGYVDTVYNLPWKLANCWHYNAGWVEKMKQWSTMRCCWERLVYTYFYTSTPLFYLFKDPMSPNHPSLILLLSGSSGIGRVDCRRTSSWKLGMWRRRRRGAGDLHCHPLRSTAIYT